MPLVLDAADFLTRCAGLSMVRLQAGETALTSGSKTGRLLVLRSGSVEVVKDGAQIAKVSTPGAVFGELAVLLDQAHTADVRALVRSDFMSLIQQRCLPMIRQYPSTSRWSLRNVSMGPTKLLLNLSASSEPASQAA